MSPRFVLIAVVTTLVAWPAAPAAASQLIDRNPANVTLAVNDEAQALITYRARGRVWHVLAWGAVNAIPPSKDRPQVKFRVDYSGGWGAFRKHVWKDFANTCRPYDGPSIKWMVTACTATDGSYWALQAWRRALPNYGVVPTAKQSVLELHLSHWTGMPPELQITLNWAYRRYDHLFGRFTFQGIPVFGFRSTPAGEPLDTFGRNLYVDTFNSAYGKGWKRENSFLMHTGTGTFCYGFYPHGKHPSGMGLRYRATIIGPGVAPDAYWESAEPGEYDRQLDVLANDQIRALGDKSCKPN